MLLFFLCLAWKWIHFNMLYTEYYNINLLFPEVYIVDLIKNIAYEELIYRWIPFCTLSFIAIRCKVQEKVKGFLLLSIICMVAIQVPFAFSHIPDDENFRTIMLELPATPTWHEYCYALSAWGVIGLHYVGALYLGFLRESKLGIQLLSGMFASFLLHLFYNLTCLTY